MALRAICIYCDFTAVTLKKKSTYKLVHWLLATGRFPEFWLVERYRVEAAQGVEALVAEADRHANVVYYQCLANDTPLS
jgi:hypothetical protein